MTIAITSEKEKNNHTKPPQKSTEFTFTEFFNIFKDGVYGFVFWSVFQGLAPMIWFYPLNELEISGYEVYAAVWLSPIICVIPGVFRLLQNNLILLLLRLIVVGSLTSFQASTTHSRLIILAAGAGVSMLVFAATLWNDNKEIRFRSFRGLIVGLHLLLVSRIFYVTFNPVWWDDWSNSFVTAISIVVVFSYAFEENGNKPACADDKYRHHSVPCGLGLGSLLFLTHWFCGEVSVITRWTVKAYPDPGPLPVPWGSLVLVSMSAGSMIGLKSTTSRSFMISSFITASMFLLFWLRKPYFTFMVGCVLVFLIMLLWPLVVDRVTQSNPALCLSVAGAIYLFQILFWVWTITYNFVPYGELTREHTDWLMAFVAAFLFLFFSCCRSNNQHTTCRTDELPDGGTSATKSYAWVIFLLMLLGQGAMVHRYLNYTPGIAVKPGTKIFTTGVWTFHFGYDNKGWPSMERAAKMINDSEVDVLTLLESDASKLFLGNNDLSTWLAETLQMYVDFGPSTKDHTYGNLILSKYPIVKSVHHLLPSPEGELAPAITASINISGTVVDFVVSHMGNDQDFLDRKLQTEFLATELRNSPNPVVFLGYMTTFPGSNNYRYMVTSGEVKDIDPTDYDRWCEYIFYRKLIRLGYARISHGGLSDTEVQLARFRIPNNLDRFKDNSKTTIMPEKYNISDEILFNDEFGRFYPYHGFFDNHGYHMGTPKYFIPGKKKKKKSSPPPSDDRS